jgi:hypothetical protein
VVALVVVVVVVVAIVVVVVVVAVCGLWFAVCGLWYFGRYSPVRDPCRARTQEAGERQTAP